MNPESGNNFEKYRSIESAEKEKGIPRGVDALLNEHRARQEREANRSEITQLKFDLSGHPDQVIETVTSPFTEEKEPGATDEHRLAELTIYNPSSFLHGQGVARVERRGDEYSGVVGFTLKDGVYVPNSALPSYAMAQDPSISYNKDAPNILTVVQIEANSTGKITNWQQQFFKYDKSLNEVDDPFAVGPEKMKDIRVKQLPNGKWAVFTRPQGPTPEQGGLGKIGYIEIDTLDELEDTIPKAPLIPDVFREGEWGGVNDIIPLNDDKIGLLSHIARMNPNGSGEKEYYSMLMIYSREQGRVISQRIVLEAKDLPYEVKGKRPDLKNVVFSGGAILLADGRLKISGGSGDTEAFEVIIEAEEFLAIAQGRL